jgi:class 3 adenylate cyclase
MDVSTWLRGLGLENYVQAFEAHDIDAEVLPRLTPDDLIALGITSIGHRRKLLDAIAALDQKKVPPAAAEPIALAARPLEAERRQLTVLFCDLVGSTEPSARLDPEDLREVIGAYQTACAEVIARFEGHIAKFLGDGVLAYFGWPRAHEDDAERAVRAGLALVGAVAGVKVPADVQLRARIGIATGQVVVGDLTGAGSADRDSVAGETPNLAARLQALAKPGSVVISQATRRLVGGLFELDDLGPQRLKGFAEPLSAWRVEGESPAEGASRRAMVLASHRWSAGRRRSRSCFVAGARPARVRATRCWSRASQGSANRGWSASCARGWKANRTSGCSISARRTTAPVPCTP